MVVTTQKRLTDSEPQAFSVGRPENCVTFICDDCGREHRSPVATLPQGWDRSFDCGGRATIRCPDCNEAIEQAKSAAIRERMAERDTADQQDAPSTLTIDALSFAPSTAAPFVMFLERQQGGEYLINIAPDAVLMRMHPLAFFLDAGQARTTAFDLLHHANLLDAPGSVPEAPMDQLLRLLARGLEFADAEIEQRQHGGNDEDWTDLAEWSTQAHAVIAQMAGAA